MFDDFTPDTDLERAFAQSAGWEIDKLWKEADRNGNREDWPKFLGQSSCLAYQYAVVGRREHLNTITTAMLSCIDQLTDPQRQSLFRVCAYVVRVLLDQDIAIESAETRLVLRVLCAVLQNTPRNSIQFMDMLNRLTPILGRQLGADDVDELSELCERTAVKTRLLPQPVLEEERKQAFFRQLPPTDS